MKKGLGQTLMDIAGIDAHTQRRQALRDAVEGNPSLREILRMTYSDDVEILLPDGDPPPYTPSQLDEPGNLYGEVRKLHRFFAKGGQENLPQRTRERIFMEMLEYVNKEDAMLLIGMKNRALPNPPFRYLTKKFVTDTVPEIFE